jgi:glycosyltransferase involved in cell wall biosynthesis
VAHYAGLKAARRHGIPVVATYHTLFEEYLHHYAPFLPGGWLKARARSFSRRQCNALDAVVVPSTAMGERLRSYGVTAPIRILPTGIPLDRFQRGDGAAFREKHGIEPDRPVALFVGRVAHEKNIGFLMEAMVEARRACPRLLLVVTGEGPAREDLRRRAAALGIADAVCFVGYLDRARELPACYAAADVFVFASRTETQGLVLLEAMAAGLPVIALSAMGTSDILDPGRGCFSPPDDPVKFGATLALFLNQRDAWDEVGRDAATYAAEWSDCAMAGRLAELYSTLGAASRG